MDQVESYSKIVIFFPAGNNEKFSHYIIPYDKLGIEYNRFLENVIVKLPKEGADQKENAENKAKAYYDKYKEYIDNSVENKEIEKFKNKKLIIMTTDEGLYFNETYLDLINKSRTDRNIEKLTHPGALVRRPYGPDGKYLDDDELLKWYTSIVNELGDGKTLHAEWRYVLTFYDGNKFRTYQWSEPVIFGAQNDKKIAQKGYPLNNITIVGIKYDPENPNNPKKKYIMLSDLTDEARYEYSRIFADNIANFSVENIINKTPSYNKKTKIPGINDFVVGECLDEKRVIRFSDLSENGKKRLFPEITKDENPIEKKYSSHEI